MSKRFDVIVIGGGPGGYVSAIRAAQLGKSVAIVEKHKSLGGTCLNVGCIPSKALLDSSELYYQAKHKFAKHGISTSKLNVDLGTMMSRKDKVVSDNTKGLDGLMKKNKITRLLGTGSFSDAHTVVVEGESYIAENIVIATGSEPTPLPFAPFGGRIISSTEALCLEKIPDHLVVIGGGVIGLELGSVYGRLGSKVTVIEFMDSLLPTMDESLGPAMQRSLRKINFNFHLGTRVTGIEDNGDTVKIKADKKGKAIEVVGDYALVCIGRRAFTAGLNIEAAGITADDRGMIPTDKLLRTRAPHVYAIGDVVKGPMLAHKAEEEGAAVAERIAGERPHMNYDAIPGVVYTWPEIASVGKTEQELKDAGVPYKVGKFPYVASGRARAADETEGFVKVLACKETDEILGVHIMAARAAEIIGEAVVAMEYQASAEDIARISHAHPTFSEPLKEAAHIAAFGHAIHI
ncbi:MAG: dihydrolipoamide dehydrogenase [Rhodothermales bacterium]|jgi:dihydrolipoamide dehydrogenase